MKKTILCLTLAALLACAGCGATAETEPIAAETVKEQVSAPQSAAEWMDLLTAQLPFDDTMTLVPENAASVYGIFDEDHYHGDCSLYISTMATPEEIAVFQADGAMTTDVLAERARMRMESQKESYASYAPSEVPKLDSAVIETVGDFVIVCVCADNAKAAELIRNAN